MAKNLDHAYDEYLKSKSPAILGALPLFSERLEKTHFRYGRFVIPTFYKPHFIAPKQIALLKRAASTLHQVINTAARLYFEEGHVTQMFHIPPEAAELIKIDPGYAQSVVFSRFNGILEGESLKVVEFNCDSAAGAAYADQLDEVLTSEEPLKDFFNEHHLGTVSRCQNILSALLSVYEEFGGYETPHIAIMDWRHVKTLPEFEYLKAFFESKGYKTTITDPRELKFKAGKLYHKDFRVDIIYRRAAFDELMERLDEVEDMLKAYRSRAVCMVNPLRSRLGGTKAILSILSNPEYDHFFTESENKVKREHIPWTRGLVDAEDFYGHKKMYLIDFLKDEKETLVLKPSTTYGGKDVAIGKETPDNEWNQAIDKALKGDWVVQEYVNVPMMTVPVALNHKLEFEYKRYNFNLLVCGGRYGGSFVRVGEESVINIARKGGLLTSVAADTAPDRFEA